MSIVNIDGTDYSVADAVDWAHPIKINRLREIRVATNLGNFQPFDGFFSVYSDNTDTIKDMYSVFNKKARLTNLYIPSNFKSDSLKALICCYLIARNLPKYYKLEMTELLEIHFGGVGIKDSLRLLINEFPCLIVDCGKNYVHNKEKGTALGILIENFENSNNQVLLINQKINLTDELNTYLEKEKVWENTYYPLKFKGEKPCPVLIT